MHPRSRADERLDVRLLAVEQAYETLVARFDSHTIRQVEMGGRIEQYQASHTRAMFLLDQAVLDWRQETLREITKLALLIERLTSDDATQRTSDASLTERVNGLNRQMLYQSIGAAVGFVLIIVLLFVVLLFVRS